MEANTYSLSFYAARERALHELVNYLNLKKRLSKLELSVEKKRKSVIIKTFVVVISMLRTHTCFDLSI